MLVRENFLRVFESCGGSATRWNIVKPLKYIFQLAHLTKMFVKYAGTSTIGSFGNFIVLPLGGVLFSRLHTGCFYNAYQVGKLSGIIVVLSDRAATCVISNHIGSK